MISWVYSTIDEIDIVRVFREELFVNRLHRFNRLRARLFKR